VLEEQLKENALAQQRKSVMFGGFIVVALILLAGLVSSINHFSGNGKEPIKEPSHGLSQQEIEQARVQFKADLQRYEQDIEPLLLHSDLQGWDSDAVAGLVEGKNEALKIFGFGDYPKAVEQLAEVAGQSQLLVTNWKWAFSEAFSAATSHFEQGNMHHARLQMAQALMVKPSDVDALALKMRIDVFPQVAQLLAAAKVSRIENKLQHEADLLQQVLTLDPPRQQLAARIEFILDTLKDNRFTAKLQSGLQYVTQGDMAAAKNALKEARGIDAKRKELTLLSNKIAQARANSVQEMAVAEVEMLRITDDWSQVKQKSDHYLIQYKDNAELQQSSLLAGQLLALDAKVERYLSSPKRLADANIKARVIKWLQNNATIAENSGLLSEKMAQLQAQLDTLAIPVEVMINSDGRTNIIVVGKGHVGKKKQYTVQLTPGHYVFEGSRKGYHSKRVGVDIVPAIINQQVTVICDERI
jgi:hypothetical protein